MFHYFEEYSIIEDYYFTDEELQDLADEFKEFCLEHNQYNYNDEVSFIDFWYDYHAKHHYQMDMNDDNMDDFWSEIQKYL